MKLVMWHDKVNFQAYMSRVIFNRYEEILECVTISLYSYNYNFNWSYLGYEFIMEIKAFWSKHLGTTYSNWHSNAVNYTQ